ncbi:uncharacterized protein EV422DRAFT_220962 [Fimicolochytrium jonesii]|uniref:uncharacterized protein n=1 Tax=Fimicolochytrium jonesii TaxID=1396493 RepID=UPI0022FF0D96|nr:uncharacterized protein EV422DRAFT_220962 [Fimicolochytrium jonesii]KAI8817622.1 hypothetical protein EV422DRAFT_220962 [Fimicolochytrium jonesii]
MSISSADRYAHDNGAAAGPMFRVWKVLDAFPLRGDAKASFVTGPPTPAHRYGVAASAGGQRTSSPNTVTFTFDLRKDCSSGATKYSEPGGPDELIYRPITDTFYWENVNTFYGQMAAAAYFHRDIYNRVFIIIWMIMWILSVLVTAPIRAEWVGFSLYSLATFKRAYHIGMGVFAALAIGTLAIDWATYAAVPSLMNTRLLSSISSGVIYSTIVVRLRGFDAIAWVTSMTAIAIDLYTKELPTTSFEVFLCVHALTEAAYCFLCMFVESMAEFRHVSSTYVDKVGGDLRRWGKIKKKVLMTRRNQLLSNAYSASRRRKLSKSSTSGPPPGMLTLDEKKVFYYSNHLETLDRFDLCLLKTTAHTVKLCWILPQSLIVTLSSLETMTSVLEGKRGSVSSSNDTAISPADGKRKGALSSPNDTISSQMDGKRKGIVLSSNETIIIPAEGGGTASLVGTTVEPANTRLPQNVPPQAGSFNLSAKDVDVMVDAASWQEKAWVISDLAQGHVTVFGLDADRQYEIVLIIRGYRSAPLRIRTLESARVMDSNQSFLTNRAATGAIDTNTNDRELENEHRLRLKLERISALKRSIEDSVSETKQDEIAIRKERKELFQMKEAAKADLDTARKVHNKEASIETKFAHRFTQIIQSVEQEQARSDSLQADYEAMLEDTTRSEAELTNITSDLKRIESALADTPLKSQSQQVPKKAPDMTEESVSNQVTPVERSHHEVVAAKLERKANELRETIEQMDREIEDAREALESLKLSVGESRSRLDTAQREATEKYAVLKDVDLAAEDNEEIIHTLMDRAASLSQTLETERAFRRRLKAELEHNVPVAAEAVETGVQALPEQRVDAHRSTPTLKYDFEADSNDFSMFARHGWTAAVAEPDRLRPEGEASRPHHNGVEAAFVVPDMRQSFPPPGLTTFPPTAQGFAMFRRSDSALGAVGDARVRPRYRPRSGVDLLDPDSAKWRHVGDTLNYLGLD